MNDPIEPTAPAGSDTIRPNEPTVAPASNERISSRRRRISWLVAGIAVALVLVGVSGALWVRYTETPQYSLTQLTGAARAKDWAGVQKYIDFEAVADNLIAGVTLNVNAGDGNGSGSAGAKMATGMKPVFLKQLKDGMRESVASDEMKSTSGLFGVLSAKKPTIVKSVGGESLVTVQVAKDGGGVLELKLKMRRVGDYWRIIAFGSAAEQIGQPPTK